MSDVRVNEEQLPTFCWIGPGAANVSLQRPPP